VESFRFSAGKTETEGKYGNGNRILQNKNENGMIFYGNENGFHHIGSLCLHTVSTSQRTTFSVSRVQQEFHANI
jgi:hypothetical protein